ncbi:MAG: DNA internalization-related competence protein ComEC/Rec2 [Ottowia sp.]|uniref:DNA internalization-related competence protein ComEC/Rec2 n=1 Tax=Ottowia sp. TaxID=1898956 RepID=UPI003C758EB3
MSQQFLPNFHASAASRVLAALLMGWILGTALQIRQAALWPLAHYKLALFGALLGGAMVLATPLRARQAGALVLLAACALAAFGTIGLRATGMQAQVLDPALEGRDIVVTGVIDGMPQKNDAGQRFRLEVESATMDGEVVQLPPLLQLGWYGFVSTTQETDKPQSGTTELWAGERWQFTVRLKAPHGTLNPHGFDYELWLWEQGVRATGYIRAGRHDAAPLRLQASTGHWIERARQSVRGQILARVGTRSGAERSPEARRYAGIIAALVTGDQNVIERADWDIFRATGVAHLMSISGLHITMFAWMASGLIGRFWRRTARWGWRWCLWVPAPTAALLGGIVLAALYALFSGWGVPAQRTILMLSAFGGLRLLGVSWPWWMTWLLACAVVLAFDPWALLQAGFWLSFVAVGVLFAANPVGDAASGKGARAFLVKLLREQGVVTLALTPLSLLIFGQVSVVGLPANLIAIPWVTLVITPLALAGVFWAPLWQAAAWALAPFSWLLAWFNSWPFASISMVAVPVWVGSVAVAGGVLLALRWPWALRLAGLPLVLPLLLWQAPRPTHGVFELLAADIGQGNAVLVRTATHTLVYDTGPRFSLESDAGDRVLVPLLRALGDRVDILLLSHRDIDHTGGARAVLAMHPGAALVSSIEDEHALQSVRPSERCQAGQRWEWDGVKFEILHPLAESYHSPQKSNNMSCVLRVSTPGATALLVGDIEAREELALVDREEDLQADVLLVPHHGSKTSSSAPFLDAVQPRIGLVQAGYRNRFGHPAPQVVERYAERGVRLFDSPQCGAMHWKSAKPDLLRCEREERGRYWHKH